MIVHVIILTAQQKAAHEMHITHPFKILFNKFIIHAYKIEYAQMHFAQGA